AEAAARDGILDGHRFDPILRIVYQWPLKITLNVKSVSLCGTASVVPVESAIVVATPSVSLGCPLVAKALSSSKYTTPNRASGSGGPFWLSRVIPALMA